MRRSRRGISTKKKKTEKDRDGGTRQKRSEAKRRSCSVVVMIKKGWGWFVARTIIQYSAGRQIVADWGY